MIDYLSGSHMSISEMVKQNESSLEIIIHHYKVKNRLFLKRKICGIKILKVVSCQEKSKTVTSEHFICKNINFILRDYNLFQINLKWQLIFELRLYRIHKDYSSVHLSVFPMK